MTFYLSNVLNRSYTYNTHMCVRVVNRKRGKINPITHVLHLFYIYTKHILPIHSIYIWYIVYRGNHQYIYICIVTHSPIPLYMLRIIQHNPVKPQNENTWHICFPVRLCYTRNVIMLFFFSHSGVYFDMRLLVSSTRATRTHT